MKICLVRHGEDMSDIYNEVGGWSDRGLSPKGVNTAFNLAEIIKKKIMKYGEFDVILTSPFARAKQTADIISKETRIRMEEDLYLKERNTYGLMGGLSKDVMKNEYPQVYAIYKRAGNMPGSERYEDFVLRVRELLKRLGESNYKNIICVTHGHLITVLLKEIFKESARKVSDGGGMILDGSVNNWKVLEKWGMDKYSSKYWR